MNFKDFRGLKQFIKFQYFKFLFKWGGILWMKKIYPVLPYITIYRLLMVIISDVLEWSSGGLDMLIMFLDFIEVSMWLWIFLSFYFMDIFDKGLAEWFWKNNFWARDCFKVLEWVVVIEFMFWVCFFMSTGMYGISL